MSWDTNQRLVTALFLDFDNFFTEVRNEDFQAASAFSVAPDGWIRWFENGLPGKIDNGQPREVTVKHCFINPRQFGRFTQPFQTAGFRLEDCLTLSDQGTTTAQIVMAMFDALATGGNVGEFIIMTSKPDYAPVLHRLRQHQRRTIAVVSEEAVPNYSGACDLAVSIREFIRLALGNIKLPDDPDAVLGPAMMSMTRSEPAQSEPPPVQPSPISDVSNLLSQLMAQAPGAVSEEFLIHQVWTSPLAADLQMSDWAGYGDCATLVRKHVQQLGLVEQNGYVYDPDPHQAPAPPPQ